MAEIVFYVEGRARLVKGITNKTSCLEVVESLLRHEKKSNAKSIQSHYICERWRECEKQLPPKAKILKVWKTWGNEQQNVKFFLKNSGADTDSSDCTTSSTLERARSPVPAHRKARQNRKSRKVRHAKQEKMMLTSLESLVQTVLTQDRQIQEIETRIDHVDVEIEYYEQAMHKNRMIQDGRDYLQNAYMSDTASSGGEQREGATPSPRPPLKSNVDMELEQKRGERNYLALCDKIVELQESVNEKSALVDDLEIEIEGVKSKFAPTSLSSGSGVGGLRSDSRGARDVEREYSDTKSKLDTALTDYAYMTEEMRSLGNVSKKHDYQLSQKRSVCDMLLRELSHFEEEEEGEENSCDSLTKTIEATATTMKNNNNNNNNGFYRAYGHRLVNSHFPVVYDAAMTSQDPLLTKYENDSDTGLSSMYSNTEEDSMLTCGSETLV